MSNVQIILKLNGLNCILFGMLFVMMPEPILTFLSSTDPMPKAVLLAIGVVLNLNGLFLMWLGSRPQPHPVLVKLVALGDFIWVLASVVLLVMQRWITESNGVAVTGLLAILVGWLGWQQWRYAARTVPS